MIKNLIRSGISLLVCSTSFNAAASQDSDVITSASVYEGVTTRTVALQPFRPVEYLHGKVNSLPQPNVEVVNRILEYRRDGTHDYWWPKKGESQYDGSTTDVLAGGVRLMKGEAGGRTFCCGLTLEVFYDVLDRQTNVADALSTGTPEDFKRLWFCREINSPGPLDAMSGYGLGSPVKFDDALPGDFMQIWRFNRSGHSVIFIAWAYDLDANRVGVHYWSTQEATSGIGFATELFGSSKHGVEDNKGIDLENTSIARMRPLESPQTAVSSKN